MEDVPKWFHILLGHALAERRSRRPDKGSRTRKLKESRMRGTHGRINEQRMIRREADRTAREQKQRAKKERVVFT